MTLPSGEFYRERVRVLVTGIALARRWGSAREAEVLALAREGLDARAIRARLRGKEVVKAQVPTLSEFKARFVAGHVKAEALKPSTADTIESILTRHLIPTFGAMKLDAIDDESVARFKGALVEAGMSPKTVNNNLTVLSVILRRAVAWKVLEAMPCTIRLLKVPPPAFSFYDFGEYARLLDAARALDPRIEIMVLLAGDAGLRRGEVLGLEWTDVDAKRSTIHVQRSVYGAHVTTPKGGRSRRVPMTGRLAEALRNHRHLRGPRVLVHEDGSPVAKKALEEWMQKATRKAGLPSSRELHALRHTFCSHLAMQGAPAKAIQELAGHMNLTTTLRYMHLSPAAKDAAVRLLDSRPTGEPVEAGVEAVSTAEKRGNDDG